MQYFFIATMVVLVWCAGLGFGEAPDAAADIPAEVITRHAFRPSGAETDSPYLLYHPAEETVRKPRALVVYLYGAGGSLDDYNLAGEAYAGLRRALLERGYYILMPDLEPRHWMDARAKQTLDELLDKVIVDLQIDPSRMHLMGTSQGGGSALAYAIHRPERVRSVVAFMPMTDFGEWARQQPAYHGIMSTRYGATVDEKPELYDINSAMKHVEVFANIPVFLVHGDADGIVDFSHSQKLYDAMTEKGYRVELNRVEGLGHDDKIAFGQEEEIVQFIEEAGSRE